MQERDLFEYAVIRLVPQVEREEFLNIGVIVYCRRQKFLDVRIELDRVRIEAFAPGVVDVELVSRYVDAFIRVCKGEDPYSPIASLENAERFRWLTANRSSILQVSAVHPGLCEDAGQTLHRLFKELVAPRAGSEEKKSV